MNPLTLALRQHAQALTHSADHIWEQGYCFPPDFLAFAGHFPDYPLLPAVVQILMAQHSISMALGRPMTISKVAHAKFLAQIRPDMPVWLRVENSATDTWNCVIYIETPAQKAAQFTLHMQEAAHAHP